MLGKNNEIYNAYNVKSTLVKKVLAMLLHAVVKRPRPIMIIGNGMEQSNCSMEQLDLNTPMGQGTANENTIANETKRLLVQWLGWCVLL